MIAIIKLPKILFTFCLMLWAFGANCQKLDTTFYINLSTLKYTHTTTVNTLTIKTKRIVYGNNFSINCEGVNCMAGGNTISFYNHDNPEVGDIFEPFEKKLSKKDIQEITFVPFERMTTYLKKDNNVYTKKYKIYFVENVKSKFYMYNVKLTGSWSTE